MTSNFWKTIKATFIDNKFTFFIGALGDFTKRPFYMHIFEKCSQIKNIEKLRLGAIRKQKLLTFAFYFQFLTDDAKK